MRKVSVIIPVYNAEKYIDRCIKSVLRQTYTSIEILLAVGRCKDHSLERCLYWQKKDDRIVIISREDTGLGDARNSALKIANGELVAFLDVDDYYDERYIEEMSRPLFEDESINITCCGFEKVSDTGENIEYVLPGYDGRMDCNFRRYISSIGYGVVWTKMYRRTWLADRNIEMFYGCHEDDVMHLILAATVKRVWFIQKCLYYYNIRNSYSLMHQNEHKKQYIEAVKYAIRYLERHNLYEGEVRSGMYAKCIFSCLNMLEMKDYNILVKLVRECFSECLEQKALCCQKVVLYGAGKDLEYYSRLIDFRKIEYVVDNRKASCNAKYEGVPIIDHDTLLKKKLDIVVISSSRYYAEIDSLLRESGIKESIPLQEYILETNTIDEIWKWRKQ